MSVPVGPLIFELDRQIHIFISTVIHLQGI